MNSKTQKDSAIHTCLYFLVTMDSEAQSP